MPCEFTIAYAGADKQQRTATQSLMMIVGPERMPVLMTVRQDSANPDRGGAQFGHEHLTEAERQALWQARMPQPAARETMPQARAA